MTRTSPLVLSGDVLPRRDVLVLPGEESGEAPLSQADYERMKGAAAKGPWRDALLLMFLRNTGLRPHEIVRVNARDLEAQGGVFWVNLIRAKKRGLGIREALFLNPVLGQPLMAYVAGQHIAPQERVFGIMERQLRRVVYRISLEALGRRVEPKMFRRFYARTVAEIAPEIMGFNQQHVAVAAKMLGHNSPRTTNEFYMQLSPRDHLAIQERIPV